VAFQIASSRVKAVSSDRYLRFALMLASNKSSRPKGSAWWCYIEIYCRSYPRSKSHVWVACRVRIHTRTCDSRVAHACACMYSDFRCSSTLHMYSHQVNNRLAESERMPRYFIVIVVQQLISAIVPHAMHKQWDSSVVIKLLLLSIFNRFFIEWIRMSRDDHVLCGSRNVCFRIICCYV